MSNTKFTLPPNWHLYYTLTVHCGFILLSCEFLSFIVPCWVQKINWSRKYDRSFTSQIELCEISVQRFVLVSVDHSLRTSHIWFTLLLRIVECSNTCSYQNMYLQDYFSCYGRNIMSLDDRNSEYHMKIMQMEQNNHCEIICQHHMNCIIYIFDPNTQSHPPIIQVQ